MELLNRHSCHKKVIYGVEPPKLPYFRQSCQLHAPDPPYCQSLIAPSRHPPSKPAKAAITWNPAYIRGPELPRQPSFFKVMAAYRYSPTSGYGTTSRDSYSAAQTIALEAETIALSLSSRDNWSWSQQLGLYPHQGTVEGMTVPLWGHSHPHKSMTDPHKGMDITSGGHEHPS
ncbi:hypothetical protein PCASD_04649 [Puccinia coronata f. sp. avenae]|uniref:Uncharacterized protein n=1 Tax=Puccinia coronata f. sp. avenae TaxID=200324 RepID=A0A2N5UXI1_9BASI|nr:hypothetical protein PCASD_04649 [Puccinia coronata f. sp. avenae]